MYYIDKNALENLRNIFPTSNFNLEYNGLNFLLVDMSIVEHCKRLIEFDRSSMILETWRIIVLKVLFSNSNVLNSDNLDPLH